MAYPYNVDYEEKKYEPPKLKTDRNVWKYIILNTLTLGVYGIFFFMPLSFDIDKVAPKKDRTKTMNFLWAYVLALFTMSIVLLVWHYHIAERIEEALSKRGIVYEFGTGTFWSWYFFGSFILIGPYVYIYKLCKAMNLLCEDYNKRPDIE